MGILSVEEKLEGATAKLDQLRRATYTRVFQVVADDYRTRAGEALLAVGIQIGDAYKVLDPDDGTTVLEQDKGSFVTEVSAALASAADDGCQWDVTVNYGPEGGESNLFP